MNAKQPALSPPSGSAALIFDCDGTLVETAPVHYECLSVALARCGVQMSRQWYFSRIGLSLPNLLAEVEEHFAARVDALQVKAELPDLLRLRLHQVHEIRIIADIARANYGKVPMAVASGGEKVLVHATLESVGLTELFDVIVTISDVRHGKPAPDLFLEAARRLRVDPSSCAVYEDSREGLEAARRAGMHGINVRAVHVPEWSRVES